MSTTDTSVTNLVFNKLTLSQYKTAKAGSQIVSTESYELTDIDTAFLESSTKYAANIDVSINSSTYVVTIQLKDQDGNALGNQRTIDLPLESVVVSGSYDSTNKKIVLTLQSGSTIDIPVGDLIAGLQSEITSENPLDADLVDDSTSTNKFVTASDKTTWSGKQDALVSGTNIKTINNNSLLGAGNIDIDSLPAQTGQSGKFLTTNGSAASWATVDALPSQTSQSGKFLTTDGTTASWATVDALPSQTSQSGKFLTTNGTAASWANIPDELPSQTGQSGKFLTTDGSAVSWGTVSATVATDGDTINKNSSDELQTIGVIEKNAGNIKYDWVGTLAQWQAGRTAGTIPDTWFCWITDDETTGVQVSWSAIRDIPTAVAALANSTGGTLDSGTM